MGENQSIPEFASFLFYDHLLGWDFNLLIDKMGLIITLPSFLVRSEYLEVLGSKVLEAHYL